MSHMAHTPQLTDAQSHIVTSAIQARPFLRPGDLPARLVIPHLAKWKRVVTIGDSVNEGLWDPVDTSLDMTKYENQMAHPNTPLFGWTDRLAGHLSRRRVDAGLSPVEYASLAIRGKLIRNIVEVQLPQALKLHPDLLIMDGGGNDILRPGSSVERVLRYIAYGLEQARETGADVIYCLANQPQIGGVRGAAADYTARLHSLLQRYDCYEVDVWDYPNMVDPRLWSQDMIHPSPECHERIAQIALIGLGLGADPAWAHGQLRAPLPPLTRTLASRLRREHHWIHNYAYPWVGRRLTGVSSGDGRQGKRLTPIVMPPSEPHPGSLILAGKYGQPDLHGPSAAGWVSDPAVYEQNLTQKVEQARETGSVATEKSEKQAFFSDDGSSASTSSATSSSHLTAHVSRETNGSSADVSRETSQSSASSDKPVEES